VSDVLHKCCLYGNLFLWRGYKRWLKHIGCAGRRTLGISRLGDGVTLWSENLEVHRDGSSIVKRRETVCRFQCGVKILFGISGEARYQDRSDSYSISTLFLCACLSLCACTGYNTHNVGRPADERKEGWGICHTNGPINMSINLTFQLREWTGTYAYSVYHKYVAGQLSTAASSRCAVVTIGHRLCRLKVLCASYRVHNNRRLFPCKALTYWSFKHTTLCERKWIVLYNLRVSTLFFINWDMCESWLLRGWKCISYTVCEEQEETAEWSAECSSTWHRTDYTGKLLVCHFDNTIGFSVYISFVIWNVKCLPR
jgi:hypothetical protein